jgi:cell volume regulation protein A
LIPSFNVLAATTGIDSGDATIGLVPQLLLIGTSFSFSIIADKYFKRIGIPGILSILAFSLILVLFIGQSPLNFSFEQINAFHTLSLALILFYAGVETRLIEIRSFIRYGIVLAIAGVFISSLIIGGLFYLITSDQFGGLDLGVTTQLPLGCALLIGACLGSTDAGPTLTLLKELGDTIPKKVKGIIKFESAVNDPAALVMFSIILQLFFTSGEVDTASGLRQAAEDLFEAFGTGLLVGGIFGYFGIWLINHYVKEQGQLLIACIAIASLTYGMSTLLEGSGFISAFIAGMFLNSAQPIQDHQSTIKIANVVEPFDEAAEIFIIILFGLSIHPADLIDSLPAGLTVAALMMFIARPISVMFFQAISPLSWRESLLVSWCGLRGAVPLALSFETAHIISTQMEGLSAELVADLAIDANSIIFIVVIVNLLLQGKTIPLMAQWISAQNNEQASVE